MNGRLLTYQTAMIQLDELDLTILDGLSRGLIPKQMVKDVKHSVRTIEARLFKMRALFECATTVHLISKMYEAKVLPVNKNH